MCLMKTIHKYEHTCRSYSQLYSIVYSEGENANEKSENFKAVTSKALALALKNMMKTNLCRRKFEYKLKRLRVYCSI